MDEHKEMVFRIANLIKENKDLTAHVNELTKTNEKLYEKVEQYERVLAQLPAEQLPANMRPEIGSKTLRFKMATVLYLDIQGFKEIAQEASSSDVIDELDQIIYEFNRIAKKHKIEKVKTIGDAYMCAGGIPVKNITNPIDVVLAALEMGHYLEQLKKEYEQKNRKFWELRMGIHTGEVTATASGKKKISYDIKGETVNIATRLASASEVGQINISAMTFELVRPYFDVKYNGKIPVKYAGDMEMHYVRRIKKSLSEDRDNGIFPNEIFRVKYLIRQITDLQELVLDKLQRELPTFLTYHNYKHTIDVVNQAELIGYGEGVDDEAILLLITAALFHDMGHIVGYDNHEFYGTQFAQEWLPKCNYTQEQIDKICELIMSTKYPPKPKNLLESILCDADLDYLGRSDMIPVSDTLYHELKAQNKIGTYRDWNMLQIKFLSGHQFHTKTALSLREVNKQQQIDRLKKLVEEEDAKNGIVTQFAPTPTDSHAKH